MTMPDPEVTREAALRRLDVLREKWESDGPEARALRMVVALSDENALLREQRDIARAMNKNARECIDRLRDGWEPDASNERWVTRDDYIEQGFYREPEPMTPAEQAVMERSGPSVTHPEPQPKARVSFPGCSLCGDEACAGHPEQEQQP